jgi:hypothetical protein
MRYSQSEKMQIIRLVEESPVSIKQTLLELNINRSTFYICEDIQFHRTVWFALPMVTCNQVNLIVCSSSNLLFDRLFISTIIF